MDTTKFSSRLTKPATRFLSEAVEHSLTCGRRTPADFLRHFPPSAIMAALDGEPRLRATFLTGLVGVREKTAFRTPSEDAGRLLQAAIEEGDADADGVASTFEPDHRVRYLEARKLWAFLTEGDFWKVSRSKDAQGHKIAQAHLAYLLDRGLAHGLLSHADLIEGISIELIAEKLPRGELAKILRKAIDVGVTGAPFKHVDLFDAAPSQVLVDHVALPHIFETVILPVARTAGYLEAPDRAPVTQPMRVPEEPAPAPSAAAAPVATPAHARGVTNAIAEGDAAEPDRTTNPVPAPPVDTLLS